jgi:hypothetical protein
MTRLPASLHRRVVVVKTDLELQVGLDAWPRGSKNIWRVSVMRLGCGMAKKEEAVDNLLDALVWMRRKAKKREPVDALIDALVKMRRRAKKKVAKKKPGKKKAGKKKTSKKKTRKPSKR